MRLCKHYCFALSFFVSIACGTVQLDFAARVKRYYCDARWICREFEDLQVCDLVPAWQQIVGLMVEARYRWFYAYDNPVQYDYRVRQCYSSIMRYTTESLDAEWVQECMAYHHFLITYYVDIQRSVVVRPEKPETGVLESRFVLLRTFLTSVDAQIMFLFYCFFFEQLANLMINKMNYLYESSVGCEEYITQLLHDQELLSAIYYFCVHCMDSPAPEILQKLAAYHKNIDSVVSFFALELLKRETT
jgi:hypothetical protein